MRQTENKKIDFMISQSLKLISGCSSPCNSCLFELI